MDDNYTNELREASRRFDEAYRMLKKKLNVRMREITRMNNALIEIWEYEGEKRVRRICKVKEENALECYKRAVLFVKDYI